MMANRNLLVPLLAVFHCLDEIQKVIRSEHLKRLANERQRRYLAKPGIREKRNEYRRRYYSVNKEKELQQTTEYKYTHILKCSVNRARRRQTLKEHLLAILGGACCCMCGYCKDIRVLQFEHINNDGYLDRRRFGRAAVRFLKYYIAHPEEARIKLQVMCANCNLEKRFNSFKKRNS